MNAQSDAEPPWECKPLGGRRNAESDAELLDKICLVLRHHGYAPTRIALPGGLTVDLQHAPEPLSPAEKRIVLDSTRESDPRLKALGIPKSPLEPD